MRCIDFNYLLLSSNELLKASDEFKMGLLGAQGEFTAQQSGYQESPPKKLFDLNVFLFFYSLSI